MYINTCCGWETNYPTELCPECHEHCDWEVIDQEEWEKRLESENQIEENKLNKI
jgi:hypothetical protein